MFISSSWVSTDSELEPESGIAIVHANWGGSFCEITNTSATKINILVTFITDWVLLTLMFIGLLRWENSHQRGGIWWLLFTQVNLFSSRILQHAPR
jgi:hypothetical protein